MVKLMVELDHSVLWERRLDRLFILRLELLGLRLRILRYKLV